MKVKLTGNYDRQTSCLAGAATGLEGALSFFAPHLKLANMRLR